MAQAMGFLLVRKGGGGEGEVRGKGRLGGRESVLHRHLHLVRLEELS